MVIPSVSGHHQSVEGLNRTKMQRKVEFTLSLSTLGTPGSQTFRLKLEPISLPVWLSVLQIRPLDSWDSSL